jgi:hypothetical protein
VSSSTLQVKTTTGSVTVNLAATTHVVKVTGGSRADLTPNARVELQLAKGTTTVNAVQIDLVTKTKSTTKTGTGTKPTRTKPTTGARPTGTKPTHTWTGTHPAGANTHAGGLIMSVSGNSITIRTQRGQTATFTLGSNVTITKESSGKLSDLAVGQTVQVFVGRTANTAAAVTILNA